MSTEQQLSFLEQELRRACIPVRRAKNGDLEAQCSETTANYLALPHVSYAAGPFCRCLSFRLPHSPERHNELKSDYDWRTAEQRGDNGVDLVARRRQVSSDEVPEDVLQEWYA